MIREITAHAGGGPRPIARAANVVVSHGDGCYLYSLDGTRMLDAISGYGVASLGHSDPRWVQAVIGQAERLAVTSLYTEELAEYLTALADALSPTTSAIALSSSGVEAVEMAIRLAQTATDHPGVLTFDAGFHGKTAAVRYTRAPESREAQLLAPHWLRTATYPTCVAHDAVDYHACRESVDADIAAITERTDLDDVSAVLIEPVLGTSGNIPPKRGFLAALRELCLDRGWLLIFDESITGFGRTGCLFASEAYGVQPDIVVLGKGLGGGFPMSAVCASPELWDRSALSAPSATSSSYGANPIACAAGAITLEIVRDSDFLASVRGSASHAARRLRQLAEESPRVAWPRGVGLMLGFDLIEPSTGALASPRCCEAVFRECRERGVLVAAHIPRVRVNPPLTITIAEIDLLFDVLSEVLA